MIRIFLPAYNEEKALGPLVEKFDAALKGMGEKYSILVLDDGSADGTAAVAEALSRRYPLTLMKHPKNLGLGETMRDGLRQAAGEAEEADVIATMDCDDTHDPKYLASAVSKLREGYDMVILSRYQTGGGEKGLSPLKSFLSKGAGFFLRLFFPIRGVREYSCGYRVMKASALKKAFTAFGNDFVRFPHKGFVVTPEILIKFRMLDFKIAEVPFVLEYGQKPGPSKNRPLRTIGGYFALVAHYWGRRAPKTS